MNFTFTNLPSHDLCNHGRACNKTAQNVEEKLQTLEKKESLKVEVFHRKKVRIERVDRQSYNVTKLSGIPNSLEYLNFNRGPSKLDAPISRKRSFGLRGHTLITLEFFFLFLTH